MADIFISHSSEDRERVRLLAAALEAEGLPVWWDRALAPGDEYDNTIAKARDAARLVIVVWTDNSIASPFVRDEAEQARKTRRLLSIVFDDAQIPAPFKRSEAEDFGAWRGGPKTPEIARLAAHAKARLQGGAPRIIDDLRSSIRGHIRLAWGIGAALLFALIAVATFAILESGKELSAEQAAQAQLPGLTRRAVAGTLSGDQAVALADLLQRQAFAGAAPSDARINAAARESFARAAAQLLQDPDQNLRMATIQAPFLRTRDAAVDKLWDATESNVRSAGALYRYLGALGADARARTALERAREADPADRQVWFLIGAVYAKAGEAGAAEGAALVGEGLKADAEQRADQARMLLERALPRLRQPSGQAFVLGRLGDIAAARDDWVAAEGRYRAALDLREKLPSKGAIAIEASKLARAQMQQDKQEAACATLQRGRGAGAASLAAQIARVCGEQN